MIPDDAEERDTGLIGSPEDVDALVVLREWRRSSVKEVAGVDDGVDVALDRVFDRLGEGIRETLSANITSVLAIPEVGYR